MSLTPPAPVSAFDTPERSSRAVALAISSSHSSGGSGSAGSVPQGGKCRERVRTVSGGKCRAAGVGNLGPLSTGRVSVWVGVHACVCGAGGEVACSAPGRHSITPSSVLQANCSESRHCTGHAARALRLRGRLALPGRASSPTHVSGRQRPQSCTHQHKTDMWEGLTRSRQQYMGQGPHLL